MSVSRRLRFEVLRRDAYTCRYCGGKAPEVALTVDHVLAVALGGPDVAENLVTACVDCNAGKAAIAPDADIVADVAERYRFWSMHMQAELLGDAVAAEERFRVLDDFHQQWEHYGLGPRPVSWTDSVRRWVDLGVEFVTMVEGASIVLARSAKIARADHWRYFCGIMWRKLDGAAIAADLAMTATDMDHADREASRP